MLNGELGDLPTLSTIGNYLSNASASSDDGDAHGPHGLFSSSALYTTSSWDSLQKPSPGNITTNIETQLDSLMALPQRLSGKERRHQLEQKRGACLRNFGVNRINGSLGETRTRFGDVDSR